jgi:hypothetical protein
MQQWLDQERSVLLVEQRVEDAADAWLSGHKHPDRLYRGIQLTEAERMLAGRSLSAKVTDFVSTAVAYRRRSSRAIRRVRMAIMVAGQLAMIVAISALTTRQVQQSNAAIDRVLAQAQQLSTSLLYAIRDDVLASNPMDPFTALREDRGVQSVLESAMAADGVIGAGFQDPSGVLVLHSDSANVGRPARPDMDAEELRDYGLVEVYAAVLGLLPAPAFVWQQRVFWDDVLVGSIRIEISGLLINNMIATPQAAGGAVAVVALVCSAALWPFLFFTSWMRRLTAFDAHS